MHEKYGKVGIGVVTTGSRKLKKYHIPKWADFFVFTDAERRGPAYARNRVIEKFEDYDHIFIFDDDCHVLRKGFYEYMLDQAIEHNVHYMAIPEWFRGKVIGCKGEMVEWNESLAACTYQSKKAVEIIGGYNTEFHTYAHEDVLRNYIAVWKADLSTRRGAHCFPMRAMAYLYYSDAYEATKIQNFTPEEKKYYTELHRPAFDAAVNSDQIYYPYKEKPNE